MACVIQQPGQPGFIPLFFLARGDAAVLRLCLHGEVGGGVQAQGGAEAPPGVLALLIKPGLVPVSVWVGCFVVVDEIVVVCNVVHNTLLQGGGCV